MLRRRSQSCRLHKEQAQKVLDIDILGCSQLKSLIFHNICNEHTHTLTRGRNPEGLFPQRPDLGPLVFKILKILGIFRSKLLKFSPTMSVFLSFLPFFLHFSLLTLIFFFFPYPLSFSPFSLLFCIPLCWWGRLVPHKPPMLRYGNK